MRPARVPKDQQRHQSVDSWRGCDLDTARIFARTISKTIPTAGIRPWPPGDRGDQVNSAMNIDDLLARVSLLPSPDNVFGVLKGSLNKLYSPPPPFPLLLPPPSIWFPLVSAILDIGLLASYKPFHIAAIPPANPKTFSRHSFPFPFYSDRLVRLRAIPQISIPTLVLLDSASF